MTNLLRFTMFQVITGDSWPLSTNHQGKSVEQKEPLDGNHIQGFKTQCHHGKGLMMFCLWVCFGKFREITCYFCDIMVNSGRRVLLICWSLIRNDLNIQKLSFLSKGLGNPHSIIIPFPKLTNFPNAHHCQCIHSTDLHCGISFI